MARQECCVKCSRKWIKIQQDQANLIPISLLLSKFQQIWCYRRKYMEHDRKGQEWLRKKLRQNSHCLVMNWTFATQNCKRKEKPVQSWNFWILTKLKSFDRFKSHSNCHKILFYINELLAQGITFTLARRKSWFEFSLRYINIIEEFDIRPTFSRLKLHV